MIGEGYHIRKGRYSWDNYFQAGREFFPVDEVKFIACRDGVLVLEYRGERFHYRKGKCFRVAKSKF